MRNLFLPGWAKTGFLSFMLRKMRFFVVFSLKIYEAVYLQIKVKLSFN